MNAQRVLQTLVDILNFVSRKRFLIAVLVSGATCIVAYVMFGGELRFSDEIEYDTISETILSCGVFGYSCEMPTAYRPPGYVFFLSALKLIHNNLIFVQAAQIILWTASALLASEIANRLADKEAAAVAFILALGYPTFVFTATTLYPQTLLAFLLLTTLCLLFCRKREAFTFWRLVALGVAMAWLVLTNPLALIYLPFFLAVAYFYQAVPLRQCVAILMAVIIPLAIWIYRNDNAIGARFAISTSTGINLLLGNSEHTEPNKGVNIDLSSYLDASSNMTEAERDTYLRDQAFNWIASNPGRAAKLYTHKFLNYFNYTNQFATTDQQSTLRDMVLFITYYGLLGLLVLRLVFAGRRQLIREEWIFWAIYIGAGLAYSIFFNRIRFRMPFDYLLVIVVSLWLNQVLKQLSSWPPHKSP